MKIIKLLIVLSFASVSMASADTNDVKGFLCIPDYSTGYSINNSKKWEPTRFYTEGMKYFLREKNGSWYWTDFGEEPDPYIDLCENFNDRGFTSCKNREDEVLFNRNTLRFQVVRPYGYVVADFEMDKHPSTPFYKIGTCSPL
jgi:hypothetical protein